MRQEPNNSIDLLLRQLGRREDVFPSDGDAQHLDADELSSYVANALPAKTRARYMQHLADCSSCRKMVAQLSAAESAVVAQQPATVVEPSGLKSFLASLFSPMVLRYAVPALGVIVIAVVGIVMLREPQFERVASPVAQVTNTTQDRPVVQQPAAEAPPTENAPEDRSNKQAPKAGVIAKAPAETAAEAPAPAPTPASTPAPPAPKALAAEEAQKQPEPEKKKSDAAAEQNAAPRDAIQPLATADAAVKKEKRETDEVATAAGPAAAPGSKVSEPQRGKSGKIGVGAGVGSVSNAPQTRDFRRTRKDEVEAGYSSAETRTVAGREFRKRGEVWIDVAYNSYQATTIIARGSEQYRALVADEPDIHTIAENLKSEFVVVWKGRAYRIR